MEIPVRLQALLEIRCRLAKCRRNIDRGDKEQRGENRASRSHEASGLRSTDQTSASRSVDACNLPSRPSATLRACWDAAHRVPPVRLGEDRIGKLIGNTQGDVCNLL